MMGHTWLGFSRQGGERIGQHFAHDDYRGAAQALAFDRLGEIAQRRHHLALVGR